MAPARSSSGSIASETAADIGAADRQDILRFDGQDHHLGRHGQAERAAEAHRLEQPHVVRRPARQRRHIVLAAPRTPCPAAAAPVASVSRTSSREAPTRSSSRSKPEVDEQTVSTWSPNLPAELRGGREPQAVVGEQVVSEAENPDAHDRVTTPSAPRVIVART